MTVSPLDSPSCFLAFILKMLLQRLLVLTEWGYLMLKASNTQQVMSEKLIQYIYFFIAMNKDNLGKEIVFLPPFASVSSVLLRNPK